MSSSKSLNIAIAGATGAVGREVLKTLLARPSHKLLGQTRLLASPRSAGLTVEEGGRTFTVEALTDKEDFKGMDVVFFTAGSKVAEAFAAKAGAAGALVIDNSSLFRMKSDVPLVVPEVNGETLELACKPGGRRIVANPNCTTAQMVMCLKPLHDKFQITRVVLASYQAVSGKGQQGIDEFQRQVQDVAAGREPEAKAFPHPIAFNCLPHIDVFQADGFTGEEHKVMAETRKILGDESIRVVATCVRVPVLNCHSEAVTIETAKPVTVEQARSALSAMPGVKVVDDVATNSYPLALEVSGADDVSVGRIRKDPSVEHGLALWIVGDNLRKGAALNAVQIMEEARSRGYI